MSIDVSRVDLSLTKRLSDRVSVEWILRDGDNRCEWDPEFIPGNELTADEWVQYNAGRREFNVRLAQILEAPVAVADAQEGTPRLVTYYPDGRVTITVAEENAL